MAYPKKEEIYLVNFDPTIGHQVKKKRLINRMGVIEDRETLNKVDRVLREHFALQ